MDNADAEFIDNSFNREIAFEGKLFSVLGLKSDPYFIHFDFDHAILEFFKRVLRIVKSDTLVSVDIGANIGMTSLALASISPAGTVYSFEPSPPTYKLLQRNIHSNNANNCMTLNIACGSSNGTVEFHDNPNSASASHLSLAGTTLIDGNCQVEVIRLDDFITQHAVERVDFIKIDVEGLELDVVNGARETLSKFKPSLFIEFNSYALVSNGNINPRELISQLMSIFPFIYRFKSGELSLMQTDYDILSLVYDNMIQNGCLDDLFCTHSPIS